MQLQHRQPGAEKVDTQQDVDHNQHHPPQGIGDQGQDGCGQGVEDQLHQKGHQAPDCGVPGADIAPKVPLVLGVVPPFLMKKLLQQPAGDQLQEGGDQGAAQEQEKQVFMQVGQKQGEQHTAQSVGGGEGGVQKAPVNQAVFSHRRQGGLGQPAQKGVQEEKPQKLIGIIDHGNLLLQKMLQIPTGRRTRRPEQNWACPRPGRTSPGSAPEPEGARPLPGRPARRSSPPPAWGRRRHTGRRKRLQEAHSVGVERILHLFFRLYQQSLYLVVVFGLEIFAQYPRKSVALYAEGKIGYAGREPAFYIAPDTGIYWLGVDKHTVKIK